MARHNQQRDEDSDDHILANVLDQPGAESPLGESNGSDFIIFVQGSFFLMAKVMTSAGIKMNAQK
jgi:hypothetical protein